MDVKLFFTIFSIVFLAELGDKTQLATVLFAANREVSRVLVFLSASLALTVATLIGVLAGSLIAEYISVKQLHYLAGIGFIVIGFWTLVSA